MAGTMQAAVTEIAPGLWRWAARHPDWHPGEFGREVASFAMRTRDRSALLVDPLLPDGRNDVAALLDELAASVTVLHVYITIPYHVRSTREIAQRYGSARVRVWGERRTARRLAPEVDVEPPEPGASLPFGGRCFTIGRPRRAERPLWIEDHAALCFGDALVTFDGRLSIWSPDVLDEKRLAFYRERFSPTLEPLLDLPVERVLVTHGEPVLTGAAAELRRAVAEPPRYHHG
ncbi:MAG: hypothetical protein LT070_13270 [Solirubrobacteraceae bacterium]|nr:hypothetical protein [Solirubrobacteraceae bacterium]